MSRFLHFGCWNENGCETNTDLKTTMDTLRNHIERNNINFVVIAGDNYYPEKSGKGENKVKNINLKMLYSGIKCLINALSAKEKIEKYILLGNHEYDDIKNIDNVNYDFMKCHIIKQQKNIFEDQQNTYFFTDVMEKKIGSTLILFIDSTIYEEENDKKIDDTCFRHIFKNITKDGVLTIKDLCDYQKEKVITILNKDENKDIKNLIVISHHPIIWSKYKEKKGKQSNVSDKIDGLIDLYKTIYETINNFKQTISVGGGPKTENKQNKKEEVKEDDKKEDDKKDDDKKDDDKKDDDKKDDDKKEEVKEDDKKEDDKKEDDKKEDDKKEEVKEDDKKEEGNNINIYHLCADTHNYQKGKIQIQYNGKIINIIQYICGTGGAHKDECPKFNDAESQNIILDNINYTISDCFEKNGFLDVNIKDDDIEFNFIESKKSYEKIQEGGYYNKYLKYKQKYLELKQSLN